MRECLGWLTTCANEQSCPQNWLERSVVELPLNQPCHVCGRSVVLVEHEAQLQDLAREGKLAAFPVVPPIALGSPGEVAPSPRATDDSGDLRHADTPAPEVRAWVCTLANGEAIRIDKASMVIGRSRTCDVVIPSAKVSRQHASVTLDGGELWIEDLGSANGVWHDGEKITRTKVANGDTFTISDETLRFEVR
ncbi:MAG: FHA domain-containing protein [Myxococcota bacterium]